ncbi:helix-turn-helix domain-containing protein [Tumebacillus flagellatus]|uniref:helix-turn-helix domain-containing protein n=1 Tax=Tumebacillus flagellatus TaxID=1157490 RepID=UPI0013769811|nr:helix-turn-helix transcriptional regulator [Tumebacillus flagellatus]
MTTLGELIKAARLECGLRSEDLADAIGVSRTYISKLENDRMSNPSLEVLRDLSQILKKPVSYFFDTPIAVQFFESLPQDVQEHVRKIILEPSGVTLESDGSQVLEAFISYFRSQSSNL